jgi:5,10-methylenetetrahydromethanopterin reductase
VRRLLAGDDGGFAGELYRLEPGGRLAYEPARPRIPLLVGTWSPRLTAYAAAEADELKLGGCANPAMVALTRARLGDANTRIVAGAVTVVDRDDAAARAHARRELALYLPVVAGLDVTLDLDPAAPADEIPDDVLDRFAFAGEPDRIVELARRLFDAGADRVEFGTPHGIDEAHGVELLGAHVLPQVA